MFLLLHYCQVKTAPSYNSILSAIIVARGETMGNVIIVALFFVTCIGYLAFVEIKSWIKNGHSALF